MVNIKDKNILGESENKRLNLPKKEIKPYLNVYSDGVESVYGTVKGLVTDSFGSPIVGALVKLMSINYDPKMHAVTHSTGEYKIPNVIPGVFKIYAISPGKILKLGSMITVAPSQERTMNFTLEDDPAMKFALIAGDVFDLNSKVPIKKAVVYLYSTNGNTDNLVAITGTNKYGQFTFRDVALGNYNIIIIFFGYYSKSISVSALSQGQIIPLKVNLIQDPNSSNGTVSGVINDEEGNPIARADVILYRIEEDNSLTPIAFTKTNSEGVYLFENVPQANYKIKSTESTIVTIVTPNSPSYYQFSLANASVLYPRVTYVEESILSNGAILTFSNEFVKGLGGVSGGSMNINIIAQISGYYDVNIRYLSAFSDSSIIMQSDPDNNGTKTNITFSKTNSWNPTDAKTQIVTMLLYAGVNEFSFFNTVDSLSPLIGDVTISYVEQSYSVDIGDGAVGKGSLYLAPFVTNLGGPNNGEVTVLVDVPFTQDYNIDIEYLSGDGDRPLKIDLDGVNIASLIVPRTDDWSIGSIKKYELNVQVDEGERYFKFYNDTGEYAPNVGDLTFNEYDLNKTFFPKDVILLDGANIKTDVNGLEYIDGIVQGNGEIEISIVVFETELYDFQISYSCTDDRSCNIKINGILVEYEEFLFPSTGNSIGAFNCQLFLEEGDNVITIYNN